MSEELTKPEAAGALVVPDFLKGVSGHEGLENVTKDDIVLPRLSVCQSMTRERKKQYEELYIPGLEEGDLFNNLTRRVVKQGDHVDLVPVFYSTSRILFKDIEQGGGILCQSFNGVDGGCLSKTCAGCPKSRFGSPDNPNEPPECTELKNVVCKDAATGELFISSFKSMELKSARKWITLMTGRNMPAYAQLYRMATKPAKNAKGDFFVRVITFLGLVQKQELFESAKADYEALRGKRIDFSPEEQERDEDAGGDKGAGGGYEAPVQGEFVPDEDVPF